VRVQAKIALVHRTADGLAAPGRIPATSALSHRPGAKLFASPLKGFGAPAGSDFLGFDFGLSKTVDSDYFKESPDAWVHIAHPETCRVRPGPRGGSP
jgi:hypothetical protein